MASVLYCSFSTLLGAFFRCILVFGLGRLWVFFQALGFRSRVWHLIALLFLVPPAAKEGKGDCEFPLCPPWILLLPLCNAGHYVPRCGYGRGILSYLLSIIDGRFHDTFVDMGAVLPCLDHAIALAGSGRSIVAYKCL